MIRAVEKVRQRLLRATSTLDRANVPYAVIGGNAVAAWVSRVDEAAVRNTQDVDLLIRRTDMDAATAALTAAGFVRHETMGVEMFLEGAQATVRQAVHVIFAGEKVQSDYALPAPDVTESERAVDYQVLKLEALVRMKLTSFRDKDRTHIRDLLGVGLVDASWVNRFPPELGARLQQIVDTPNG
jgi:hypothetical protein